ncbi:MAG: 50S ribosomal protein L22, partial [Anaerolineales bacterium]
MDVKATHRYVPMSAFKLRLVCNEVRNMGAQQAQVTLEFMPHRGATYVGKLLDSAIANAEENFELNAADLYIAEIYVDEGPSQRRVRAGARGRYKPRTKRSAHLT